MSFFRYPGGKSKLKKEILSYFILDKDVTQYREPFFGGGSIGIEFLKTNPIKNIWINDYDLDLRNLWKSVISYPEKLKKLIVDFNPSVEAFDNFRKLLIEHRVEDVVESGFMKLAIHQLSYSGLGLRSGGPLGGRNQNSKYPIDCRWSPDYLCKKIDAIHDLFETRYSVCTNCDFSELITNKSHKAFIYLDPPYYHKGNDLYYFGFNGDDHYRLMRLLQKTKHQWVLSYDDCEEIRDLYSWAKINSVEVTYNITTSIQDDGKRKGNKKKEVIIIP